MSPKQIANYLKYPKVLIIIRVDIHPICISNSPRALYLISMLDQNVYVLLLLLLRNRCNDTCTANKFYNFSTLALQTKKFGKVQI